MAKPSMSVRTQIIVRATHVFVASDDASFIAGTVLDIDGGQTMNEAAPGIRLPDYGNNERRPLCIGLPTFRNSKEHLNDNRLRRSAHCS
jgi:hypothetical protein